MDEINTSSEIEREKLAIERERVVLERERLETERLRHKETVQLSNNAAGRIVLPVSTLTLALVLTLIIGAALGTWVSYGHFKTKTASIAASVAHAMNNDDTNSFSNVKSPLLRVNGKGTRGPGYLLILD